MKLTKKDRETIYHLFHVLGETNISKLARDFKVSRSYIQFIVYPERQKRNYELKKARKHGE